MNALPFLGLFRGPTFLIWRSLVAFLAFAFRRSVPSRVPPVKSRRVLFHARLHASFVLVLAVVLACAMVAPAMADTLPFSSTGAQFVSLP